MADSLLTGFAFEPVFPAMRDLAARVTQQWLPRDELAADSAFEESISERLESSRWMLEEFQFVDRFQNPKSHVVFGEVDKSDVFQCNVACGRLPCSIIDVPSVPPPVACRGVVAGDPFLGLPGSSRSIKFETMPCGMQLAKVGS